MFDALVQLFRHLLRGFRQDYAMLNESMIPTGIFVFLFKDIIMGVLVLYASYAFLCFFFFSKYVIHRHLQHSTKWSIFPSTTKAFLYHSDAGLLTSVSHE